MCDEQDAGDAEEQRGAGVFLIGGKEGGAVETAGDGSEVERGLIESGAGEAAEPVHHARGSKVKAAVDAIRGSIWLNIVRVHGPETIGVERIFGIATDRGDRGPDPRLAPHRGPERLMTISIEERRH